MLRWGTQLRCVNTDVKLSEYTWMKVGGRRAITVCSDREHTHADEEQQLAGEDESEVSKERRLPFVGS